jgi:ribosomal protein L7Ae-like RNA K-turn-binding protein
VVWKQKNAATDIFKMLNKYRPESKEAKDERRKQTAEKGAAVAKSKDQSVKCGINQIARLVESKKATMVIIAHDVRCDAILCAQCRVAVQCVADAAPRARVCSVTWQPE